MLQLSSTYIIARNMERSVEFYSLLFGMEPSARISDRWAQFDISGGCFGIFNQMFDYKELISGKTVTAEYNKSYIDRLRKHNTVFGNNVIHHFRSAHLNDEYERLEALRIGPLSDILYVNIDTPYYFFTLSDPDGNIIEITGSYADATDTSDPKVVTEKDRPEPVDEKIMTKASEPVDEKRPSKTVAAKPEPPKDVAEEPEQPEDFATEPEPLSEKASDTSSEHIPFSNILKTEESSVTTDEIRSALRDENSPFSQESFFDRTVLKAALMKERERQLREKISAMPIFKPIPPEPEEPEPEILQEEPTPTEAAAPNQKKKASPEPKIPKRPIWEEETPKDLWSKE